jgi:polar amino acid transport system substrate-binding protein
MGETGSTSVVFMAWTLGDEMRRILLAIAWVVLCGAPVQAETVRIAAGGTPPYLINEGPRGIVIDLLREAFALKGYTTEVTLVPVRRAAHELEIGSVDGVTSINGTDLDPSKYFVADPIFDFEDYIFTLKDRGIKVSAPEDLDALSVATFPTAAVVYPDWLKKVADEGRQIEVSDQVLQVQMLYANRVDAVLADARIMAYMVAKVAKDTGEPPRDLARSQLIGSVGAAPAFRTAAQRDALNAGIAELRASGRYDEIVDSYTKN